MLSYTTVQMIPDTLHYLKSIHPGKHGEQNQLFGDTDVTTIFHQRIQANISLLVELARTDLQITADMS
jgi:hypothetical protein